MDYYLHKVFEYFLETKDQGTKQICELQQVHGKSDRKIH